MWFLLLLKLSLAGSIGIQTTSDLALTENNRVLRVQGKIEVKNTGNEQAQGVHIEVLEPKVAGELASVGIAPGEQNKWEIESVNLEYVGEQGKSSSQIPVVFLVKYQDINGYNFSAPSVVITQLKSRDFAVESAPKVSANVQFEGDGEYNIRYQIKNESDAKVVFHPSLILPKELQLVTREAPIEVAEKSEISVSYQVSTRGALSGSRYNIFLLLRWQEGDIHRAASFVESLEIRNKVKSVANFRFEDWVLIGLLLVAGYMAFVLLRNRY